MGFDVTRFFSHAIYTTRKFYNGIQQTDKLRSYIAVITFRAHADSICLSSEGNDIAEFCSPSTLASLSLTRTHSAFQVEAEQTLYHALTPQHERCLETLAMNSKKAGYVHVFQDDRKRTTINLLKALINMHALFDLRLNMDRYELRTGAWIEALNNILWSVYQALIFSS